MAKRYACEVFMKPISTLRRALRSVDIDTKEESRRPSSVRT